MSTSNQSEKTPNKSGQTSWFTGLVNWLNKLKYFSVVAVAFFFVSLVVFLFGSTDIAIYLVIASVASSLLEMNRRE